MKKITNKHLIEKIYRIERSFTNDSINKIKDNVDEIKEQLSLCKN